MTISKGSHIGPYIIEETLKKGGMAQLYRGRLQNAHQEVAIKVNLSEEDSHNPQNKNALRQEVDILTRLDHPGVIRIQRIPLRGAKEQPYMARELKIPGHPWYYVMEFLPGGSLSSLLKDVKKIPFSLASAIGLRSLDALVYIHSRGIVHLDLKLENVLLRRPLVQGSAIEPVLIDFGVAAQTKQSNATGGTLITMSPEYIRKIRGELAPEQKVDLEKVDIYALGVVMYRMWTGQYPFGGLTERSLSSAILHEAVQPPRKFNPELPIQVDSLLQQWLSKDPIARPSLEEIRRDLVRFAGGMTRVSDSFSGGSTPKSPIKTLFGRK
jgi:eukaryotic-like serine/threonine-protein kinase